MSDVLVQPRWRHDLKNQLSIALGFSEMVLEAVSVDDPVRPDVQEVLNALKRALALVSELDPPHE